MALLRGLQRSAEEKESEGERKHGGRGSATITGYGVSLRSGTADHPARRLWGSQQGARGDWRKSARVPGGSGDAPSSSPVEMAVDYSRTAALPEQD